jgi:hypothetical protein
MPRLEGLGFKPAWIFGGTGHAFAINVHEQLSPSGPTAWKIGPVDRFAANVGYLVEGVMGHSTQRDFEAKQRIAWALVTGCIDSDVPCYAWEMAVPEWYVITGYDDGGYYFSGPGADQAQMPLAADEIARALDAVAERIPFRMPEDLETEDEMVRDAEAAGGAVRR